MTEIELSTRYSNHQLIKSLMIRFPIEAAPTILLVNISKQRLYQIEEERLVRNYIISSASKGTGNQEGSNQTPLGAHFISEKFGDEAPIGSQFKGRKLTGDCPTILTQQNERSAEDNITSRILWLSGLELGHNKGGLVDSHDRYIYIHGTDEEGRLGTPASHGCIRMGNQDIIELYSTVAVSTLVYIYQD